MELQEYTEKTGHQTRTTRTYIYTYIYIYRKSLNRECAPFDCSINYIGLLDSHPCLQFFSTMLRTELQLHQLKTDANKATINFVDC